MTLNLKLANNAKGTLAVGINASDVTIQLNAGQGALFPTVTAGSDYCTITATDVAGNHEIMVVTARAFDVLTVIRGQENTLARSYSAGTIVENRLTAASFLGEVGRLQTLINTAITTFDPGPGTDLTTASVKAVLLGALTTTELSGGLAGQIAKIDGAVGQIGSVNQRIKVETDNRVAAVQSAIDLATGFHTAEVGDRIAYVQNYAYSKTATDAAVAFQASVTQAAYTAYADTAKTQAVALAAADVRTYAYSRAGVDSAIATQSSIISAAYTAYADAKKGEAISTASADVRNYSYSQAQVNSAIAASETQLRSEFVSSGGVTQAYLANYAYSKSDVNSAIAAQTSTLTANYTSAINGIKIGGRNWYSKNNSVVSMVSAGPPGCTITGRTSNGFTLNGISTNDGIVRMGGVITKNGQWTISFDMNYVIGSATPPQFGLTVDVCDSASQAVNLDFTGVKKHFSLTFNVTNWSAGTYNFIDFNGLSAQPYTITNFKVEEGNKETSWTPSPDDVSQDIANAITTSAADVRSYSYSQATIDAAIASVNSQLTTTYNNAVAASNTYTQNYTFSQSAISGALNAQSNTLTANYQSYADARKNEAINVASADVRAYTYSQSTINGAFSSQSNALTANYQQYADARKTEAINTAAADVRSYTYAAATIDGAIASSSNSVNARLNNAGGAGVTVESKLSATASAVAGLQGQAVLEVTAGDVVTGIRINGSSSGVSSLKFRASNVLFEAPGVTPKQMVTVDQINGVTTIGLHGDVIIDGSLNRRTIGAAAISTTDIFASVSSATQFVVAAGGADVIINGRVYGVAGDYSGFDLLYEGFVGSPGSRADRTLNYWANDYNGANPTGLTIQMHLAAGLYFIAPYNTTTVYQVAITKIYK